MSKFQPHVTAVNPVNTNLQEEELKAERETLAKASQLHWFHWFIVCASVALTFIAASFFNRQVEQRTETQFNRESVRTVELVIERMRKYEDALWAGTAAIASQGGIITHKEWRTFAKNLRLETKYPGINGIGLIESVPKDALEEYIALGKRTRADFDVHPKHAESESLPIVFIEPEAPNEKAVGLDIAHEENRYQAARKARDTGAAQITGPIVLVQDEGSTSGFLFYAPFYEAGTGTSVLARRDGFLGMVYAPFVVKHLIEGTLEKDRRHVGIRLSDDAQVIYDELDVGEIDYDPKPLFIKQVAIELYGRTWTIDVWSSKSFRQMTATNEPLFVLFGGIAIDFLLFALFLIQSRASRKTLDYADRLTAVIKEKSVALEKTNANLKTSNADLESFAYVASHDLKTPLRGIRDLTSYLEEDLSDYLAGPDVNPDVAKNIGRLYRQAKRMDNLIRGILEYSSVDGDEELAQADLRQMVSAIGIDLDVGEEQLQIGESCPVFETYAIRLHQVLANLIGNAFKYHPDMDVASVDVGCRESGEFYEISITDNGAGIERKYHQRIFEAFQTLQAKDEIESTGIGLAIVKKTIEALGGKVWVTSTPGEGTKFTFLWPRKVEDQGLGALEVA